MPATIILIALALSIPLSAQTITTFDAPGAGTGPAQGPNAWMSIAPKRDGGWIFLDPDNVVPRFVGETHGGALVLPKSTGQ